MFTSSLVVAYCLYMQWSALSSNPSSSCNPFSAYSTDSTHNAKANTATMMTFGLLFTFVSLFVVGGKTKSNSDEGLALQTAVMEDDGPEYQSLDGQVDKEEHVFPISGATIYF